MNAQKLVSVLVVMLFAGIGSASAHGGRVGVGVHFGPYWGPGPWYYPPYYYRPEVVVVPAAPPTVYIEQQDVPAETTGPAAQQYWYYCASAKGYYPYVKECAGGWQKVLPQPAK